MTSTYQIPATTHLGEVSLRISNLERSIQFYTEVVGLKLLERSEKVATMTADGKHSLLRLEQLTNAVTMPVRSTSGLYHFAILLPDRKSLGLALRNLAESGIEIGQGDHLVSEAFYISDPDQNGIEIYADRARDTWKRDADNNYIMSSDPVDVDSLFALAANEPWQGLPAGTVIGHVHFHVRSLEESRRFYTGVLGFDIVGNFANMSALFVSAGGYHHHIGLNIWAGTGAPVTPDNATGIDYFTIIYDEKEQLKKAVEQLRQSNASIEQQGKDWFTVDPQNIRIRLTTAG
ncbi:MULTISPECIES: VOC family protein [unclassified Paenibacillus]|uniref:VOC family protein n=1 Tax=unclassified Paenibacillus TaxID=185978 RepID=UPI0009A63D94|nr:MULTISPECIES: VOC family protein [unclassified Paenibacillus]SLK03462.1 catechol 2,3-dioxygenase [Paenibacillus sp. RU5A]SOC69320.1 catechol 2,3-dioxygenase [Paenibacillus sp. RU26A]SOC71766.1 catechol 2,3-dioxygenase [Paenibacillus sp. RU5M]